MINLTVAPGTLVARRARITSPAGAAKRRLQAKTTCPHNQIILSFSWPRTNPRARPGKKMIRVYLEFLTPLTFLIGLLFFGSSGYMYLEEWTLIDALYMTVITITTVGFSEVAPLSENGKLFTMFLVVGGVSFYGVAINVIFKTLMETNFRNMIQETKLRDQISKLENHFIICGGGRMAYSIARELDNEKIPFVIIENNEEALVVRKQKRGWFILKADALLEETLIAAGVDRARGLASVLPTDADNLFVVLSARRINPEIRIETRIAEESSRSKMLQAGADKVVSPYVLGGLQIARNLTQPSVDEFIDVMLDKSNYEFEVNVINIKKGAPNEGKTIRDTNIRSQGFIIIGLKKPDGQFITAPQADVVLEDGDEIVLVSSGKEKPLE